MSPTPFCWSRWNAASRLAATRFWERVLTCRCGRAAATSWCGAARRKEKRQGSAIQVIKELLRQHRPATVPGLPPFTAGAVGYFAYDAVRQLENIGEHAKDDFSLPDCVLMFFDRLLAFDHLRHQIHIIATADVSRESSAQGLRPGGRGHCGPGKEAGCGIAPGALEQGCASGEGQTESHAGTSRQRFISFGGARQGIHRRRGHLPGRAFAAAGFHSVGRALRCVSRLAHGESFSLSCISCAWGTRMCWARRRRCWCG